MKAGTKGLEPRWVALAIVAATLWAVVVTPLFVHSTDSNPLANTLANDRFRTWLASVAMQAMLWIGAIGYVLANRDDFRGPRTRWWHGLVPTLVIVLGLSFPGMLMDQITKAEQGDAFEPMMKFHLNAYAGGVAVGFVVWAIVRIHLVANELLATSKAAPPSVAGYLRRHDRLGGLLLFAGGILALALFGTHMSAAAQDKLGISVPVSPTGLNRWAMVASGVLAVLYLSARLALTRLGRKLRDALCPLPAESGVDWPGWHERRAAIDGMLRLQRSPLSELTTLFGVLAPIVGSLMATFVP